MKLNWERFKQRMRDKEHAVYVGTCPYDKHTAEFHYEKEVEGIAKSTIPLYRCGECRMIMPLPTLQDFHVEKGLLLIIKPKDITI